MLCEVRMAKPRVVIAPADVLNSRRSGGRLAPRPEAGCRPDRKAACALGQVGRLGGPVVHLDVDVRVVIGMPRRIVAVVPQPLQIGRQAAGARAGNQQVAAILEKQFFQLRDQPLSAALNFALVGGQGGLSAGGLSQIERHAVEERLKILFVRRLQRRRSFSPPRFATSFGHARVRIFAAIVLWRNPSRNPCPPRRAA